MSEVALLSGNEAVARGLWEAGGRFASAYPGTPSTEILENVSRYEEFVATWGANEKTAFEMATGASVGGARALVAMKHVGLNVAADPLMSFAYAGVNGGFIVVTADDPGMHSSQNEQDNRWYAFFAKVPILEPSDSQEAKDFVALGFELSETYDTPVILRLTTRISHSKTRVTLGPRQDVPLKPYKKDVSKNLLMPANARTRHAFIENERLPRLKEVSETSGVNRVEWGDRALGIITGSIAYQYAREVYPGASFLKIGMVHPFPDDLTRRFASEVKEVLVIEELDPIIENNCRRLGLKVRGKDAIPITGELDQAVVRRVLGLAEPRPADPEFAALARPPVFCPGCAHRPVFLTLHRMHATVTGDIGCYTLGALPPLSAMDTCLCMGASITQNIGMVKVRGEEFGKKAVAVIGDSTFFHSGITGLVDCVFTKTPVTVVILDNDITAMTGHQENPGTGRDIRHQPNPKVDIEALAKSLGVGFVRTVLPYEMDGLRKTLEEAMEYPGVAVVIARARCVLLEKDNPQGPLHILQDLCDECGACLRVGCPAVVKGEDGSIMIDERTCVGAHCSVCAQVCKKDAILTREGVLPIFHPEA